MWIDEQIVGITQKLLTIFAPYVIVPPLCNSDYAEENVSTEEKEACAQARFSCTHENQGRASNFEASTH